MKTLKLALGIALFTITLWSCKNETEPQVKTVETAEATTKKEIASDAKLAKAEFNIEGMTCAIGCAKTIEKKLSEMEGVKSATVDFDNKLATVEYDEASVTTTSLEETVIATSDKYSVNNMKTVESFSTDGAKKGCDKECKTKCSEDCTDKDCEKCAALKAECKKTCDAKKASCKGKSKKECKKMKGDKASMDANHGEKMAACKKDCKKACCADKA